MERCQHGLCWPGLSGPRRLSRVARLVPVRPLGAEDHETPPQAAGGYPARARATRHSHAGGISYNARPFVLCGLPLRRPPADQLVYTRHNGSFVLEITAHPRFGLPYGQDRLIPIWIATLTLKQKSRIVHFESPTQLLEYFHLPKDGAQYRRVRAAFERIFAATIFFGTEQEIEKQIVVESARFHLMDSMRLWFYRTAQAESPGDDSSDNTITLSETFYQEITAHPIPVEREVIAALAHAPGLLDFYVWIAWKSWTVNGQPSRIPIFGQNGLSQQLGTAQYSVDRLFRHKITQWLQHVKLLWPECPAQMSEDGRFLVVQSSRKSTALHPRDTRAARHGGTCLLNLAGQATSI